MLKLNGINKSFGKKNVLKGFSLSIKKGEMVAITGPSGCGKSTLLNIIGLIDDFQNGSYQFDGMENIKVNSSQASSIIRNKISYLFQNFALMDSKTVEENLMLALFYQKLSKHEKKKRISQALEQVGLKGYENDNIFELSGGEQQRVAIARAILKPSIVILADEPTGSLDRKNKEIVLDLLRKLNQDGKTILIVTHDPEVAEACSRTIELI
ncbi:ABC transporter ATP-binding protein [Streptococcus ruminantium]|uniref:ABC transporter ATP-binding protein n=1 Tax=Streptococcus ruminantium TaxID=1917441 RepID=UPI0012DF1F04|nr:ABC transporter ATP-binding protein [Streptococcus ruminantium]